MSEAKYAEIHPDVPSEGRLKGIIRVLVDRLGGRAVIEKYELRRACLSRPLIVPQTNGDVIVSGES